MFSTLPIAFRKHGLSTDIRTLLLLRKAFEANLVKTLGDIYNVLKGIIVKAPDELGPFTKAYYQYFLAIDIKPGETLQDAILRSKTFKNWKNTFLQDPEHKCGFEMEDWVNKFLDDVHMTKYDIKEVISGRDLLNNDDPNSKDKSGDSGFGKKYNVQDLKKLADYSDVPLEELMDRMRKVMEQQKTDHSGGSHWIGTGGISPYGHGGAAKNGIRVKGTGGGRMARRVIQDKNCFPIDKDTTLNDGNMDAALAALKGAVEESANEKLDIDLTIKSGLQRGGLFLPQMQYEKHEKIQIILLVDNGGYSMSPHIKAIQYLFRKMKIRFAHDLEVMYFHNTIYDAVYTDEWRSKPLGIERLLTYDKNYRLFFVGDASMAPYELNHESISSLRALRNKFKKSAWLNPEPLKYWPTTYTLQAIMQVIPMFPLTPRGIERAVLSMNTKNN